MALNKKQLDKNPRKKDWPGRGILLALSENPWFAYATILALQLRITWGMWRYRDLTAGDTSSYFVNAYHWFHDGLAPILWSPLYTSFYGTLLHFSSDAFTVTVLHRYLIIFASSVLVLALMRRLLPPDIAWLVAAWWVVLPIDFDTMYEVHLFAVLPVLWAALRILKGSSDWSRGEALAWMLIASLLVRNELLLATGLLAAMMWGSIVQRLRGSDRGFRPPLRMVAAYVVPLSGAGLLTLFYYSHASDLANFSSSMDRKHTLNICQTYAFGYQQRYSDFQKSPWTDCQELMTRIYGKPEPSLMEALRRNPSAMTEHFLWNARLIPYGLQVLLLNVSSSSVTPDYAPVTTSRFAWIGSAALLLIAAAGLFRLVREWQNWWEKWLKARIWAWLLLATVAVVTCGVMISQRPRPSYMLTMGILLRAAFGMLLFVLVSKWKPRQWLRIGYPIIALAAIACASSYYRHINPSGQQPLKVAYERLAPFQEMLERPGTVVMTPGYGGDLCNYVGVGGCSGLGYYDLRSEVGPSDNWLKVLNRHSVSFVYLDNSVLRDTKGRELVASLSSTWVRLYPAASSQGDWMLFENPQRNPVER